MKEEKKRRQMIFIFMLGFLSGIIYTNIVARTYVTLTNVFHESYLEQYTLMDNITVDYVLYLFQYRLIPFMVLALFAATRYKKIAAIICIVWTGFSAGVLAVTAVLSIGVAGMLICLAALFPHFLFYGISYLIILWYCMGGQEIRWNKTKSVIAVIMQIAGIMAEGYLNPWIMKMLIGIFV